MHMCVKFLLNYNASWCINSTKGVRMQFNSKDKPIRERLHTTIDKALKKRATLYAVSTDQNLNDVIEAALKQFLKNKKPKT